MSDKMHLQKLTPVILDEEKKKELVYESYEQAFDLVFAEPELCNIALSGPYGAGKSTLLRTYEADHPEKKCIHISLARFGEEEKEQRQREPENGKNAGEHWAKRAACQRDLEIKTLNQLIHQISPELIPQTQFRIKEEIRLWKVISYACTIFTLLVSGGYLLWAPKAQWSKDSGQTLFDSFWKHPGNLLALAALLLALGYLVWSIVKRQLARPLIKSIHVDKSQIDLVEDEKETNEHQFDRYMDEIIYLFRRGKIDALVLEDMDRFDNIDIFNELREINFLINRKCKKEPRLRRNKENQQTGTVKFIYMVKDELFEDYEQRTKFFDLIIPVVPVIDSSNSYDLLVDLLNTDPDWREKLDESYLKTICFYIRDYRVLKNIYNEYQIYYRQLKGKERALSPMKLFAMITYKNLWPLDYARLQRDEGVVYRVISSVEELRKKQLKSLPARFTNTTAKMQVQVIERASLAELLQNELRQAKKQQGKQVPVETLLGEAGADGGWNGRFSERQRLVAIFLRDGMLGEDYTQYMTYFYPYSLTEAENRYLNRVYAGTNDAEQVSIRLEHPQEVLMHLRPADYRSAALPNVDLLHYLLRSGNQKELDAFVGNLDVFENTEFAVNYTTEEGDESLWFKRLTGGWDSVIQEVIGDEQLEETAKLGFLINCVEYAEPSDLETPLTDPEVGSFREAHEKELMERLTMQGLNHLKDTSVLLEHLGRISWTEEKWRYVYTENMYLFNRENLAYIFQEEYQQEFTEELWRSCYQTIRTRPDQSLAVRVEKFLNDFLEEFYLEEAAENAKEPELVLLLNHDGLSEQNRDSLLQKSTAVIEDLSELEDQGLWSDLLEQDRAAFNRDNILAYWQQREEIDEALKEYLIRNFNRGGCELSFEYMIRYLGETLESHPKTNTMLRQLLNITGMGSGYRRMLSEFHVWYNTFPWNQVEEGQIGDLVAENIIRMTASNLKSMREREDQELLEKWISGQQEDYCKLMEDETLRDEEELHALLDCGGLSEAVKEELVGFCGSPIQIKQNHNSRVIAAILNADLLGGGYDALFNRYRHGRYSREVLQQLEEYWTTHVKRAVQLKTEIPDGLLLAVCGDERVLERDKKALIAAQVFYHDRQEIQSYLELLEDKLYARILGREQVRVEASEENQRLLEAFLHKNWIAAYRAEEEEYVTVPEKRKKLKSGERRKKKETAAKENE